MRALVFVLVASSLALSACGPRSNAVSASLVDDVLEAQGHAVDMFTVQVEHHVEVKLGAPVVIVGGKAGTGSVEVGGIKVGNGKVVVPGVATVGGP